MDAVPGVVPDAVGTRAVGTRAVGTGVAGADMAAPNGGHWSQQVRGSSNLFGNIQDMADDTQDKDSEDRVSEQPHHDSCCRVSDLHRNSLLASWEKTQP